MSFKQYKDYINIMRGIEKECLRTEYGKVSQISHGHGIGSPLTNSYITTDFSEALIEFITPPYRDISECLNFLEKSHIYAQQNFKEEIFWPNSMPCELEDGKMPLAQYGSSNIGKLKTLYRSGLSHRYGSSMQMVAGIHYNISFGENLVKKLWKEKCNQQSFVDFKSQMYFDTIRNYRKYFWLFIYLFGASPIIDKSFVRNRNHKLEKFDEDSLYLEYATCLRMGKLGYQSSAQDSIQICYNDLPQYIDTLNEALTISFDDYKKIGLKKGDEYLQINDFLLQIENEYYSIIRPKMPIKPLERPLSALKSRGVEYLEVRLFDLDPFSPIGIKVEQAEFTDLFMLFCLLSKSPIHDSNQCKVLSKNQKIIVEEGRKPGLKIWDFEKERDMKEWGLSLLDQIESMAVDLGMSTNSISAQRAKFEDSSLTPSAKLLEDIKHSNESFLQYTRNVGRQNRALFLSKNLSKEDLEFFENEKKKSIKNQEIEEKSDKKSFDDFLKDYQKSFL